MHMLTQRSRTYISSAGQPRSGRPLWAFRDARSSVCRLISKCAFVCESRCVSVCVCQTRFCSATWPLSSVCAAKRSARSGGQRVCARPLSVPCGGGEMLTPASHCVSRGERTHTHTHTPPPPNATQTPPRHGRRDEQRHAEEKKKGVYSRVGLIFSPVCLSISWQLPCWIMTADSDSARPVRLQTPGSDQCLICSSSAERGGVNERCK